MKKVEKIDFTEIPIINVDCIFGIGVSCRVAESIKRNGKRFFSTPFDWMSSYGLDSVIKHLKNKGKDFFIDCSVTGTSKDRKFVIDNKTKMLSVHNVPLNLPDSFISSYINKIYKYKFRRLDYILKKAKTICILSSRAVNIDEITKFIDEFTKMYKFEHIYFANVCDSFDTLDKYKESLAITKQESRTIVELTFNDENKLGRDAEENINFWQGNTEYWDKLLSRIIINYNFKKSIKIHNFIFRIDYDFSSDIYYIVFTIFGKKFKFKTKL